MAAGLAQVLSYHRVARFKFELSGLRTGSIRDQMLRARLLTDALFEAKYINRRKPLVVAGGGVAGITCALNASRRGVEVTLLESKVGPFRTQMAATSRFLDPSEFDWPHPSWESGQPPWPSSDLPLLFVPSDADLLALDWEDAFFDWMGGARPAGSAHIDFFHGVDARNLTFSEFADRSPSGGGIRVLVGAVLQRGDFGAAISCIGFSGEKVSLDGSAFKGFEFWGQDPVDQPNCGVRSDPVRVLISGGGDGAQQDFLRVLTGQFGGRLYRKLRAALPTESCFLDAVLVEDEARRAFAWRQSGQRLPRTLSTWNDEYVKVVERIWGSWDQKQRQDLADTVLRPGVHATWILGGAVPDYSYGLNRFLALLVARLHAWSSKRLYTTPASNGSFVLPQDEVIVRGQWLHNVDVPASSPTPHVCGRPNECTGIPHRAVVRGSREHRAGDVLRELGVFDLVLIRHGVDQDPLFKSAPISEQMVPRGIPC